MELARVTEASAIAAGRWMGRGDKHRADGRRSTRCASCSTRSRWTAWSSSVRARRTRRRCSTTASGSATASPPQVDIAVDPHRRHDASRRSGLRSALAVIVLCRARRDVQPGTLRVHVEDRGGSRGVSMMWSSTALTPLKEPRGSSRAPEHSSVERADRDRSSTGRGTHDLIRESARAPARGCRLSPTGTSPVRSSAAGPVGGRRRCSASAGRPRA